ncbi:hypothetical protein [Methylobacterium sp. Leaf87]|jgi:hypothetical protein|nr:hypothetical protein [Methylobacterium sp. Leaf87]
MKFAEGLVNEKARADEGRIGAASVTARRKIATRARRANEICPDGGKAVD